MIPLLDELMLYEFSLQLRGLVSNQIHHVPESGIFLPPSDNPRFPPEDPLNQKIICLDQ
jgi:hypothetical protein